MNMEVVILAVIVLFLLFSSTKSSKKKGDKFSDRKGDFKRGEDKK